MEKTLIIFDGGFDITKGWAQDLVSNFKKIYEKKTNENVKIVCLLNENKKSGKDIIYIKKIIRNVITLITDKSLEKILEIEKPKKIIIHIKNITAYNILKKYKIKNKCKIIMITHDYFFCCPCVGNSCYYQTLKKIPPICEDLKISINCLKCFKNKFIGIYYITYHILQKKYFLNLFDIIISPSNHLAKSLKKYGFQNVYVINNSIDLRNWRYYGYPTDYDSNLFLYVGRIVESKGIYQLLEAFSEYIKENEKAKLLLIGSGHEENKVKKLIESKNLEKNVKLIGFVNRDKLKEYYKKCVCLIVPSIWMETFGMILIEAMATGKVVIGSNFGGPYEIISKSKGGFVFNPFDTEDFVKTLKKVHSLKKEELEKIGLTGRKWVEKNCDLEKYVDSFIKLINL